MWKKILDTNTTKIPIVIGLIIIIFSTSLWVSSFSSSSKMLQQDIDDQATQTAQDIEKSIENKIKIIENILLVEWTNVKQVSELYDEDRFYELIPGFYEFYSGYLSINLVTKNGTVLFVYPLDPNSSLINKSLLYNVDGAPNLTIRKANSTGSTALSTFVTFYQGGSGLSSYIPIFYNESLVGYFNVVFRTAPLFSTYISEHQLLSDYKFVILENETEVYRYNGNFDVNNKFVVNKTIMYYDRSWNLYMIATEDVILQTSPISHISILLVGLIASIFVGSLSLYLVKMNKLQEEKHKEKEKYERLHMRLNKMNSLGTMAGGMAHDFNNILMIIQGNLSLIEHNHIQNFDNDDVQSLESIKKALTEGDELTQQILLFSRHHVIENERIEIISLLEERIELFQSSLDTPIEVSFHSEVNEVYVYANTVRMGQIIFNLLNNSVQAIEGKGYIDVSARTIHETNENEKIDFKKLQLTIKDSGKGIEPLILDKIFDPFFTTKDIGKGSGLGLAVAYRYITSIDGHIDANSEIGKGTTINITLPVLNSKDYRPTIEIEDIAALENKCQKVMEHQFGANSNILVIEDEQYIARVIENIYDRIGSNVTHNGDGTQGLATYQKGDFDLIILDVNLPGMNGVDIFKKVMELNPTQYIIFVTGFAEQLALIDIEDYDTVTFLKKPFSHEDLYLKTINIIQGIK